MQANGTVENFPTRLRGVFAFATLSNGTVVTIDVDDWDAPCRRPDPMVEGQITGSLDVPQPDAGEGPDGGLDLDPYHTPTAYQQGQGNSLSESPPVTLEQFFPVSAPHRMRSSVLVRNDPTSGVHIPNLVGTPQLTDLNGTPVATSGLAGIANPLLLPTVLQPGFTDPTDVQNPTEPNPALRMAAFADAATFPDPQTAPTPGVRLSFEDPTVTQNQDWTVTYEGVLPSSPGIFADIAPSPPANDYTTLTLTTTGANLCSLGIEDWDIGQARATAAIAGMKEDGLPVSTTESSLKFWTTDYAEVTSDILPQGDPYWSLPQACWDIPGTDLGDGGASKTSVSDQRYDICQATFGAPGSNPDLNVTRDVPILEAYSDHLKVGRFGFKSQLETTANRTVDSDSPNNPTFLKLITCCFNKQAAFKVRAGGEWIAVGQQGIGLLNHVVAAAPPANNRCVLSCDPNDALLNARSFDIPWSTPTACKEPIPPPSIGRNDPLAMRNPMFSYVTWSGCGTLTPSGSGTTGAHTLTARDLTWKFSVSGGFSPLTISLGGANGVSVNPQSMLYIPSISALAVVDGAQQGLVLIDLNIVAFSTNYF